MIAEPKQLSLAQLRFRTLASGAHDDRNNGLCAMETAAWLAGEPHSDQPECVSPIIAAFVRRWNADLPSNVERDRLLKPLLPIILDTATGGDDEERRAWLVLDWLVRTYAPAWLDLIPTLTPAATALREFPAMSNQSAVNHAIPALTAAWDAAWEAAWDAAGGAARAAASGAAMTAAREAASGAAVAAAWDAAGGAAWDAAWEAAWDAAVTAAVAAAREAAVTAAVTAAREASREAARAAVAPTIAALQASAQALVRARAAVAPTIAALQASAQALVRAMAAVGREARP